MLLVTGATGYVGRHFLQSLPDEVRRDCLTPSRQEFDLTDAASVQKFFKEHSVDRVLHLAAVVENKNLPALLGSNIIGLYYLLKECRASGVRYFAFASGNTVYGSAGKPPFPETQHCLPDSENWYSISKYYGELMVADMLPASLYAIVRIGDIYGPNQKTGALLKAVVNNILNAQPQRLYGQGDRTRDYIYIDDVVDGLRFILENSLTGVFNLATGTGTSVREILHIAEKLSNCKEPTIAVAVEKEDHSKIVLDTEKLEKTGWTAAVSFEEGLRRIVEEMRNTKL